MPSTLQSNGPNGTSEYVLNERLSTPNEEIYFAERVAPAELRGPVIVKYAPRTKPNFVYLKEKLFDEAVDNAIFLHPNLTAVVDVVENDGGMYLVLENVPGTDLGMLMAQLGERGRAMSFPLAVHVCMEVLKGIHHLHNARDRNGERRAVVIRDITPANVLLSVHGQVKIANRGLSAAIGHIRKQRPGERVAYYAPERIAGEPFSIRTDLFAVGVMLFELLVGRHCFEGGTTEEVLNAIVGRGVPIAALDAIGVPESLRRAVFLATNPLPEQRFATVFDMGRALEPVLSEARISNPTRTLGRFLRMNGLTDERAGYGSGPSRPSDGGDDRALVLVANPVNVEPDDPREAAVLALREVSRAPAATRTTSWPPPTTPPPQPLPQPQSIPPQQAPISVYAVHPSYPPHMTAQLAPLPRQRIPSDLRPPKHRSRETMLLIVVALLMLLIGMVVAAIDREDVGDDIQDILRELDS